MMTPQPVWPSVQLPSRMLPSRSTRRAFFSRLVFEELLSARQAAVSQQLSRLRLEGLVAEKPEPASDGPPDRQAFRRKFFRERYAARVPELAGNRLALTIEGRASAELAF